MLATDAAHVVKRLALLALGMWAAAEAMTTLLFALRPTMSRPYRGLVIPVSAAIWFWIVPFGVVRWVERGGWGSLGFVVPRGHGPAYMVLAAVFLVLPGFLVPADGALVLEFFEQIVYIGLAEEVFNRGYLQARLSAWLGGLRGVLVTALLFGLAHVLSRLGQLGVQHWAVALEVGGQALLGGLLFGYVYLRTGSIVPGAIIHVGTNAYLGRLLARF